MKILFIIGALISGLSSQDMGYKMYKNGDIDSALDYYKQLVDMDDKNLSNEELLYNIGTIYAQIDSTNKANAIFETVYQDSSGYTSELSYNYGNTLYRSQKLEESLKAFRETLLKDPEDLDARKNYEFVKNEIEKNKSMQKEKDKSKESDEEKNEEDKDKDKEKEKEKDKKDDSQNDKSNNEEDNNDSENNDNGPTDNQNSKSPDQQNEQNRDVQSKQSAENILNAIKENEKVNKKRKQTNYSNESGKDW